MAHFAPVAPAHILEGLDMYGQLGTHHLLLAHDIFAHTDEYRQIFNKTPSYRAERFNNIILDNSVIELGTAVDIGIIAEAAKCVQANIIVLPDTLLNSAKTAAECLIAVDTWKYTLDRELGFNRWSYMIAPQGNTLEEFVECAQAFADPTLPIGWWGIPRNLVKSIGTRCQAIQMCHAINPNRRIHLLGFSDNVIDDILCAQIPYVNGIDSAVPIRATSYNITFEPVMMDLPPRGDWWTDAGFEMGMVENVYRARQLFSSHSSSGYKYQSGGSISPEEMRTHLNQRAGEGTVPTIRIESGAVASGGGGIGSAGGNGSGFPGGRAAVGR